MRRARATRAVGTTHVRAATIVKVKSTGLNGCVCVCVRVATAKRVACNATLRMCIVFMLFGVFATALRGAPRVFAVDHCVFCPSLRKLRLRNRGVRRTFQTFKPFLPALHFVYSKRLQIIA